MQVFESLAELEKVASAHGQDTLNELVHGVLALPVLKTKEAMREAVQQSELQNFASRHPHLEHILTKFEDPQMLEQIKTAAYHEDPSFMKLMRQGRRTKSNVTGGWSGLQRFAKERREQRSKQKSKNCNKHAAAKGTSLQQHEPNVTVEVKVEKPEMLHLLVWTEGWGCKTTLFVALPAKGDAPLVEVPIFGDECEGWPSLCYNCLTVDMEKEGVYFTYGNYSQESGKYENKLMFLSEKGPALLADLGSSYPQIVFDVEKDMGYALVQEGKWPDQIYQLYSGGLEGSPEVTLLMGNITYGDKKCLHPSNFNLVKKDFGPPSLLFTCSKDWKDPDDENKIVVYSPVNHKIADGVGGLSLVTSQADYYGYMKVLGESLYYSQWVSNPTNWKLSGYDLYSCFLDGCDPEKIGELPKQSSYNFLITGDGALLISQYIKWDSDAGESVYNVTATPNLGNGTSTLLFYSNGFNNAQILPFKDPMEGEGSETDCEYYYKESA